MALDRSGGLDLGGLRPGVGPEGGPRAGVTEPGSGRWMEMEFDCEGLRRLLGKVRAARWAGSGAPGCRGRAASSRRFPGSSRGSERRRAGLKPAAGSGPREAAALSLPSPQSQGGACGSAHDSEARGLHREGDFLTPPASLVLKQLPALACAFNHAFLSAPTACPFFLDLRSLFSETQLRCHSLQDGITPLALLAFRSLDYHVVE